MDYLHYLTPGLADTDIPLQFPSPFSTRPHPLAQYAADDLQRRLASEWGRALHDFYAADGGKMFGVLVVRDQSRRIAYLSAFSGMLGGSWDVPGFVPPVFDKAERETFMPAGEAALVTLMDQIDVLEQGTERRALADAIAALTLQAEQALLSLVERHARQRQQRHRQRILTERMDAAERTAMLHQLSLASQRDRRERREQAARWRARLADLQQQLAQYDAGIEQIRRRRARLSLRLQRRLFATYVLRDAQEESRPLMDLFPSALPPGGSGDCAAPKLLQYAHAQGLQVLAMAEFWWGQAPTSGVRHHGHYYPSCRSKCGAILPFMLGGVDVALTVLGVTVQIATPEPTIIYEDDALLVVDKPVGLLSVPGKLEQDSVLTRLRQRYPDADGPLLVHRLDMATSGLLLAAKSAAVHKALQRQFIHRRVEKRYVAVVETGAGAALTGQGQIELPLRVDLDDRPRQCVCHEHGKPATTHWRVIEQSDGRARVYFYPLTGRTHQLRIHAAHRDGLAAPIVGDELYGHSGERLLLHAERLRFLHPLQKRVIEVLSPAPF